MGNLDDPLVAFVSHPPAGAEAFARALVERGLAACVQRTSVTSTYRWEGAVHDDAEVLLVVKTDGGRWSALEEFVAEAHPYDVPELVALAPERVAGSYRAWWGASLEP